MTLWKTILTSTLTESWPSDNNGQGSIKWKVPYGLTVGNYQIHVTSMYDSRVEGRCSVKIVSASPTAPPEESKEGGGPKATPLPGKKKGSDKGNEEPAQ